MAPFQLVILLASTSRVLDRAALATRKRLAGLHWNDPYNRHQLRIDLLSLVEQFTNALNVDVQCNHLPSEILSGGRPTRFHGSVKNAPSAVGARSKLPRVGIVLNRK
jgi:hypothetical protein